MESWSVTSDGVESAASDANRDRHAGGNASMVERRRGLKRARRGRVGQATARSSDCSDSPRPSVSKRSFHDGVAACEVRTSAALRSGSGSWGVKRSAPASASATKEYRADANEAGLQSICLRMNVGISMSLRSCEPFSTGGRGGRWTSLVRGADAAPVHTRGTIARERNHRRALGRRDGRRLHAPASCWRRCDSARSKPVAMTVTRISPCIAGSCTAPKMISASSPTAS